MDVSVIIVSYNTVELTLNCIKSIIDRTNGVSYEIIVSDNLSSDNTVEQIRIRFPKVKVICNKSNLGFGAANNRALEKASGKYIFYLNSDTILLNNAVKFFFDYWEKSNECLGAIGAKLLSPDMTYIHSGGIFPTYKSSIKYYLITFIKTIIKHIFKISKNKSAVQKFSNNIQYVTGADLFLKNDDYAFFDERYFLYFEETDLQYKMFVNNKTIKLIEGPQIIHLEGGSNNKKREYLKSFSFCESCKSNILYLQKNYRINKIKSYLLGSIICLIYRINLDKIERNKRITEIKKICKRV